MSVEGAFVTGAASGMGLRCVIKLLDLGLKVTGFDVSPFPTEQLTDHQRAHFQDVVGDVSVPADISAAVQAAVDHAGRLDRAFNAAGVTGKLAPIFEQQDDALDRLFAINVRGVYLSMKYEAQAMRECGGGSIVNFSSVYSLAKHENMVRLR